ncbi:MAG: hypothetical protein HY965_03565 [Ignavibacteriales bacterium]|nr:hypothetical protein [Ignavibacteriales bacterium]
MKIFTILLLAFCTCTIELSGQENTSHSTVPQNQPGTVSPAGFYYTEAEGMTFLRLPYSAEAYLLGMTGASRMTDDPAAFTINPAQLGMQHLRSGFAAGYNFFDSYKNTVNVWHRGIAATAGFNLSDISSSDIPLQFGIGYSNLYNKWIPLVTARTENLYAASEIRPYEEAKLFSFGIGMDYGVKLSAGITYKQAAMHFVKTVQRNLYDFGVLVHVPVLDLLAPALQSASSQSDFSYSLIMSMGFTRNNDGRDAIKDETYKTNDGLTHTVKTFVPTFMQVGFSSDFSIIYKKNGTVWLPLRVSFSTEQVDQFSFKPRDYNLELLTSSNEYQSFIHVETETAAKNNKGFQITAGEVVTLLTGSSESGYYQSLSEKMSGWKISSKGILKIIGLFEPGFKNSLLGSVLSHFHIQYISGTATQTGYSSNSNISRNRMFYSISLSWCNQMAF